MVISMTGFGAAELDNAELIVMVEIRTLNSKYLDINFRLPRGFPAEKELELRNLIKEKLQRGKVSATLEYQYKQNTQASASINEFVVKSHYQVMQRLAEELKVENSDLLRVALQMPDAIDQALTAKNMEEKTWQQIETTFAQALEKCQQFRQKEGKALEQAFKQYIQEIEENLEKVTERDEERLKTIREKIQQRISELANNDLFDPQRFEQEMLYYIERLDISEEKVRLKTHLKHFLQVLEQNSGGQGKKLNFISQEIGREINTIASKANDAPTQRYAIEMKESLEKIKEQVLNLI